MSDKYIWGNQTNNVIKTVSIDIERVHSQWSKIKHKNRLYIVCNNCGTAFKPLIFPNMNLYSSCPNCGAKMKGE